MGCSGSHSQSFLWPERGTLWVTPGCPSSKALGSGWSGLGCSGSHSPGFLVAWNEMHAELFQFSPPQLEGGGRVALVIQLRSPVAWHEVCVGLL